MTRNKRDPSFQPCFQNKPMIKPTRSDPETLMTRVLSGNEALGLEETKALSQNLAFAPMKPPRPTQADATRLFNAEIMRMPCLYRKHRRRKHVYPTPNR